MLFRSFIDKLLVITTTTTTTKHSYKGNIKFTSWCVKENHNDSYPKLFACLVVFKVCGAIDGRVETTHFDALKRHFPLLLCQEQEQTKNSFTDR